MKKRNLSNEYLSAFCLELSLLVKSGAGLGDGILSLAEDGDGEEAEMLKSLANEVNEGKYLSEVLTNANSFPDYMIKMVEVGERTGRLGGTLSSLSAHYDSNQKLAAKIKSMIFYPCILMVMMLVVVVVLLVKVLPIFESVYAQLGVALTGIAAAMMSFSSAVSSAMPVIAAILGVIIVFVLILDFLDGVREKLLRSFTKRRGDKGISRKVSDARFASALAAGLSSGLPIEEAMGLAIGVSGENEAACKAYQKCLDLLNDMKPLGAAFRESGALSPKYCQMIALGVRSGYADTAMEEAAARIQDDAEIAIEKLVGRIEPAMIIFISVIVGVIILSVMLPLLNIMSAIG